MRDLPIEIPDSKTSQRPNDFCKRPADLISIFTNWLVANVGNSAADSVGVKGHQLNIRARARVLCLSHFVRLSLLETRDFLLTKSSFIDWVRKLRSAAESGY